MNHALKMVMKKTKGDNVEGVDIHSLSHMQLLVFVQKLQNKLEKEQYSLKYTQLDRDRTDVFLKIANDKLNKCKYDIAEILKTVDENKKEIIDLKNLLRTETTMRAVEKKLNIDEHHLNHKKSLQLLTENCKIQQEKLIELNLSLERMLRNNTLTWRSERKNIDLRYVEYIRDNVNFMEEKITRLLNKAEKEFMISNLRNEKNAILSRQNYQKEYDDNTNKMIELFSHQILKLETICEKNKQNLHQIRELNKELKKVNAKNNQLAQSLEVLTETNEKLTANKAASEKRIKMLETKLRVVTPNKKLLSTYKQLYDIKVHENELLEKDNANIREGFQKYDECFIDVLVDLKEQYYLKSKQQQ